ncbi:agmatine deiminase [Enterococcus olivae]
MKKMKNKRPKDDGFYMPAEFSTHRRTYMIWPQRPDNWRLGGKPAQKNFVEIAHAIADFEEVVMLVQADQYQHARQQLNEKVVVIEMSTNDAWARDTGASFIKNQAGELRGIDWRFNAWGGLTDGLYFPWDLDDMVAQKMCQLERCDRYFLEDFVLEGGSFHVDGEGTALVTEACLLSAGRNPHLTKAEIEAKLKEYLNVECVIWVPHGIYQDETNEHIDNLCAFIRPGEVVLGWTENKEEPQYAYSQATFLALSKQKDHKGRSLIIHKIPIPTDLEMTEEEANGLDQVEGTLPRKKGDYLGGSYINFYFCNGAVILPAFGHLLDKKVKELFSKLLPDRKIIQIYSREVLLGGGNIHCITQQVPL